MPYRGPHICGCGKLIPAGIICECQRLRMQERNARYEAKRPSARERGYDGKWQVESKAFLALPENRLCACGCGRNADMVDHIIPHRGDKRLFWARSNWQALATSPCHSRRKQSIEKRKEVTQ
jgi:5-methylcytosine-specific restriction endonuclease McrA